MASHEIEGDLRIEQEGPNVRAIAGALNMLFPRSEREAIVAAYNQWRGQVLSHFNPRWRSHQGAHLDETELLAIICEITLHWMHFCVMHRMPVQMGEAEWDHPQTRRIIRAAVERGFARGSDEATALCAQLMGISPQAYLQWAETEETFLGIM